MAYLETYKEVKEHHPNGLRDIIRKFALNGLSILDQLKGIEDDLNKPRIQSLYFHHVFKDEEKPLDQLLKRLSKNHEFISYSEAITKILEGTIDKPYICFSSDDGYKNNLKAAEILKEYNASTCFFINPSIVGKTSFNDIKEHCKTRLDFPPVEFLNWNDIEKIQKMGHEIGAHTMDHINVANTDNNIFLEDCIETYNILQKQCGEANHFAFPYGRFSNFNKQSYDIVFKAGFGSCANGERGCHINHPHKLSKNELYLRRDHIILDWNLDHIFYFIAKNSRKAMIENNLFTN